MNDLVNRLILEKWSFGPIHKKFKKNQTILDKVIFDEWVQQTQKIFF